MTETDHKPGLDRPQQTNYETARARAGERLSGMDFEDQCQKAGVLVKGPSVLVRLIDRLYSVDRKSLGIKPAESGPLPELWEEIIILHYLITASGAPPSGRLISYQQVPDGAPYYANFRKRTAGILLPAFGERLSDFKAVARKLGAREVFGYGDLAVSVPALPRVEYLFVCYEPDHEFPPELQILFDSSILDYLPAEDITVLCQMLCIRMVRGK
jgi:hypothetical protein